MKEISPQFADDRTDECAYQQIELQLDIRTQPVYTASYDPYWDTLEQEEPTHQQNSCDILDQQCVSFGIFCTSTIHEPFRSNLSDSAHQQKASIGEQFFIDLDELPDQHPHQYASVGAQVILATEFDIRESSVGAQVTEDTQKFAPQHEKLAHWVEKYWVKRAENKYWYFRYRWMSGRKSNRVYLGSVRSRRVQEKVELVREAIADGKLPDEIKQLISDRRSCDMTD